MYKLGFLTAQVLGSNSTRFKKKNFINSCAGFELIKWILNFALCHSTRAKCFVLLVGWHPRSKTTNKQVDSLSQAHP